MPCPRSAQAKLNRATQQCEALEMELEVLSDHKSYAVTKDVDPATGTRIYRFADVPPMPDDLSLRIGEALYNYRCSLDHLIWQLVLSSGKKPTCHNEFPIFNDIVAYDRGKGMRLEGVPDALIPIIDALQPCNSTPPGDYWWYLWYLHELNNADKHRHLLLTRRTLGQKLRVSWVSSGVSKAPSVRYHAVPVENGAGFARLETDVDVEELEVHPVIQTLFSDTLTISTHVPVDSIIRLIDTSVRDVFNKLGCSVR